MATCDVSPLSTTDATDGQGKGGAAAAATNSQLIVQGLTAYEMIDVDLFESLLHTQSQ